MNSQVANYYRIERAIGFLVDHFKTQPDLDTVASEVYMSPFHFQKMFTDWVGISPKKFIQYLTLDFLRGKIRETENMMDAADLAGLSSQSRVHDLFIHLEGVSPRQYKTGGAGIEIFYGYHATPFGLCFIAVAEKGICALKFIDEEKSRDEFQLFSAQWGSATLQHRPDFTQDYIKRIFKPIKEGPEKLELLLQGSPFQIKVWEALLKIPFGSAATFQQVARMIGHPNAARAVGSAVGSNTLLYLIPCHRVIAGDGSMGDYHYGRVRKMALLGWEMASSAQTQ